MKFFILGLALSIQAQAGVNVVYGEDNRKDLYEVTNPQYLKWASSTAAMIPKELINTKSSNSETQILTSTFTLENTMNVCSTEKFSQQANVASCSGFLISPTKLVTAGHCYVMSAPTPKAACANFKWVFNYGLTTQDRELSKGYSADDIYSCKNVVIARMDTNDFAVIELDRPVVGHAPLSFRKSGTPNNGDPLVVIGHPSGLPTKIADDAKVLSNPEGNMFATNLDTFQGNSGSVVINTKTGLVEGILVQGRADYIQKDPANENSCLIVNTCENEGGACLDSEYQTLPGEIVVKITSILNYLN
jgi:V8-like Glu-specific endopeptidase